MEFSRGWGWDGLGAGRFFFLQQSQHRVAQHPLIVGSCVVVVLYTTVNTCLDVHSNISYIYSLAFQSNECWIRDNLHIYTSYFIFQPV